MATEASRPSWRVMLARYDRLVGFDLTEHKLSLATATRYATRGRIVLREAELRATTPTLRLIFSADMPHDHPLIEQKWARNALPFIGRPGSRSRFWTLSADGVPFIVTEQGAKPFAPLSNGAILKVCDRAILILKPSGEIVASERASGRTLTRFQVPSRVIESATAFDFMDEQDVRWLVAQQADGGWHLAESTGGATSNHPAVVEDERIVGFVSDSDAGTTPAAVTINPFGEVYIRDEEWDQIADKLELDEFIPSVIRAAPGGDNMPWIAVARLDAEGFVSDLGFGDCDAGGKVGKDPIAFYVDLSTCLAG